jgi:hypothetical protein
MDSKAKSPLETRHPDPDSRGVAGTQLFRGFVFLGALAIPLIILRLGGIIDWPWWLVLLPLYGPPVIFFGFCLWIMACWIVREVGGSMDVRIFVVFSFLTFLTFLGATLSFLYVCWRWCHLLAQALTPLVRP